MLLPYHDNRYDAVGYDRAKLVSGLKLFGSSPNCCVWLLYTLPSRLTHSPIPRRVYGVVCELSASAVDDRLTYDAQGPRQGRPARGAWKPAGYERAGGVRSHAGVQQVCTRGHSGRGTLIWATKPLAWFRNRRVVETKPKPSPREDATAGRSTVLCSTRRRP